MKIKLMQIKVFYLAVKLLLHCSVIKLYKRNKIKWEIKFNDIEKEIIMLAIRFSGNNWEEIKRLESVIAERKQYAKSKLEVK